MLWCLHRSWQCGESENSFQEWEVSLSMQGLNRTNALELLRNPRPLTTGHAIQVDFPALSVKKERMNCNLGTTFQRNINEKYFSTSTYIERDFTMLRVLVWTFIYIKNSANVIFLKQPNMIFFNPNNRNIQKYWIFMAVSFSPNYIIENFY